MNQFRSRINTSEGLSAASDRRVYDGGGTDPEHLSVCRGEGQAANGVRQDSQKALVVCNEQRAVQAAARERETGVTGELQ